MEHTKIKWENHPTNRSTGKTKTKATFSPAAPSFSPSSTAQKTTKNTTPTVQTTESPIGGKTILTKEENKKEDYEKSEKNEQNFKAEAGSERIAVEAETQKKGKENVESGPGSKAVEAETQIKGKENVEAVETEHGSKAVEAETQKKGKKNVEAVETGPGSTTGEAETQKKGKGNVEETERGAQRAEKAGSHHVEQDTAGTAVMENTKIDSAQPETGSKEARAESSRSQAGNKEEKQKEDSAEVECGSSGLCASASLPIKSLEGSWIASCGRFIAFGSFELHEVWLWELFYEEADHIVMRFRASFAVYGRISSLLLTNNFLIV
eukprot:CAMPEP_0174277420 /NCGR_PEP_ID=MMETSP0439-20130205/60922_1 /TAXON_ID=0 /ORGANISM="Stereomyxa ramosa, Strain Chinc5" /LENGTH=322 /DNA_ID=CAMNT_0015369739 /DNA_START=181 /DNA_END=1145 /DNA_ORIENTATION=+